MEKHNFDSQRQSLISTFNGKGYFLQSTAKLNFYIQWQRLLFLHSMAKVNFCIQRQRIIFLHSTSKDNFYIQWQRLVTFYLPSTFKRNCYAFSCRIYVWLYATFRYRFVYLNVVESMQ